MSFSWCANVQSQGDLPTAAAVLTEVLTHSQMHSSEVFLAFDYSPHQCISVFLWNIGDSFLLLVCVCRKDLCASASFLTGLGHRHFWETFGNISKAYYIFKLLHHLMLKNHRFKWVWLLMLLLIQSAESKAHSPWKLLCWILSYASCWHTWPADLPHHSSGTEWCEMNTKAN